jgi:hypothetical protein
MIWFPTFFGILFASFPVIRWMDHQKPNSWLYGGFCVLFFGFMFGNLAVVKWLDRRQARKHRLICATCDGLLTETAGKIAVETCHCCRCGARVLLETPVAA